VRIQNVLELVTRLKQLCNVDPVSGRSAKLADLHERLATLVAEGHRALVFSQFTDATFGARAIAGPVGDPACRTAVGHRSGSNRSPITTRRGRSTRHALADLSRS
jgi:hypothetical protein